jgi:hypothetical protein
VSTPLPMSDPGSSVNAVTKTNGQLLAEMAYPGDLAGFVGARRDAGDSWRTIRDFVNSQFNGGVTVTHQALINWYAEEKAA